MDPVRFGLSIRALRRRRLWTQAELGRRARVSRSAIARIERGEADQFTIRLLTRVASALGARIAIRVLWQGEALDRLLDADHAARRVDRRPPDRGWLGCSRKRRSRSEANAGRSMFWLSIRRPDRFWSSR
jgi:transcriptional regulator with XRE-family HTH domain